ncbi:aminopeptidase P family protein [Candidatus Sneabacter namystus]|uniref:Aminopeptidase P family protein n=1 Tax=Candidatus Sneabacter namystus TaxID=2601646 RepID=A0A5C0UI46_9RICK|nr:aminopeptidase P family protein [Candidatus Sneabacter namystus]QEK39447.1 aminopeptidase P family protein [Candidatus Sneabacter namystus]
MDRENTGKVDALRSLYKQYGLSCYLISSNDEYGSMIGAEYSARLRYITGFSGSYGIAAVFQDKLVLITDSRYLLQAEKEMHDVGTYEVIEQNVFVSSNYFSHTDVIGYDASVMSSGQLAIFDELNLVPLEKNLVDIVWHDQPKHPSSEVFLYEEKYSGESSDSKIYRCLEYIKQFSIQYLFIYDPISVNWLLNIRARDLCNTPVLLCHALISASSIIVFTYYPERLRNVNLTYKDTDIIVEDISDMYSYLDKIKEGSSIIIDSQPYSELIERTLSKCKIVSNIPSPSVIFKAEKNEVEISTAKQCHIEDAVAVIETFTDIYKALACGERVREFDVSQMLIANRQKRVNYVCESFDAICGYGGNGAMIHYRPDPYDSALLQSDGILLIDSGGQYLGGTTDVTRNLVLGDFVTEEQKLAYTKVLKGHISLANVYFTHGTCGLHLDILARQFLLRSGMTYGHGTGHGVGNFLCVHEGPQSISPVSKISLKEGMILSNEPGFYKEGEFGIRIENLCYVTCVENSSSLLKFEQLTMLPYCAALIQFDLLSYEDKAYLRDYYKSIVNIILPRLSSRAATWCEKEIKDTLAHC